MPESDKRMVLVVDDQPQNLQLAASVLSPFYRLILADNGEKALRAALEKMPDLILLDIMMPGMSGYDVCSRLKENEKTADIPVIFLTAKSDENDFIEAFDRGGSDYVTKPFRAKELKARIETHIAIKVQRENIRRINEELLAVNNQKDKLFSIISHDLKANIGGVCELLKVLCYDIPSLNGEEIQRLVTLGKDNLETTYEMLNELLAWARNQFNQNTFSLKKIDLKASVQKVINQLNAQADSKEVRVSSSITKPVYIQADDNMVNTVLRNLISNAIKFSKPGKQVIVHSKPNNGKAEVSVVDQGIGIKPENISKLFDVTSNFTTYGTKGEKGTGLGLDLCHEFITKMKGDISVKSTLGEGTTFTFTLPLSEELLVNDAGTSV